MEKPDIKNYFQFRDRWGMWEVAFWLSWVGIYFVPGANLILLTQIMLWGLFAASLDILLGYRGIPSLGHAAYFGIGAYCAGLLGKHGWSEPITAVIFAGLFSGCIGWLTGRLIQGLKGITVLMITLSLNMILFDIVQRSTAFTGGDDGLTDIVIHPVFDTFRFDMYGKTAYLYVLAATFILFVLLRRILLSPFGLALRGSKESERRMIMLGTNVSNDTAMALGLAAAVAGVAGALLVQTTQFVSPEVMSFTRSADVLIMLAIGGTGTLYGGFIGALVFILLRDQLAASNPIYWYFWIGLLLVLIVSAFRRGILPTLTAAWNSVRRRS